MTENDDSTTTGTTITPTLETETARSTVVDPQTKRVVVEQARRGFQVKDLVLIAILLAAGLVLKMAAGTVFTFGGMKPNFMIAMYCLAILLTRPKLYQGIIIGLMTGILCQLATAVPLVNLVSEPVAGLVCSLLVMLPLQLGKFDARPLTCTFLTTVVSGYIFASIVVFMTGAAIGTLFTFYAVMVFGTAFFNCVIVQVLYIPLKKALKF
jgi:hypothetical protein